MDRLSGMAVFAAVVEAGSFSAAARRLGLSKAAISKQVQRLEDRLGARLLNRTTRRLGLTEVGARYFESCQRILAEAEEAERTIGQLQTLPRGTLRVNAPMSFGVLRLAPMIPAFLAALPELRLDLALTDRTIDLVEEGFDLAIRIGAMPDSSLVARRLAASRQLLVAAPAYLAARGVPEDLDALSRHDCLSYSYQQTGESWRFETPAGPRHIPLNSRFRVNNGSALREAVVGGLGIALLPSFIVCDELAAGRLRAITLDGSAGELQIHAVSPHNRHATAKVRAFVDFLVARFGPVPPWEQLAAAAERGATNADRV